MTKIPVIIQGFGNVGKYVLQSLDASPDMKCIGVMRQADSLGTKKEDLRGCPDFCDLDELIKAVGKPKVAIICGPSRRVPEEVIKYLEKGINTVDSFDIHSEIAPLLQRLQPIAAGNDSVSVSAAGWDPGTDSAIRALLEAMAPVGSTFTNFGRGRSMGHSVAAREVEGVIDAIAITIPLGGGRHSRLVYVLPEKHASKEEISKTIAADPYFCNDPLEVCFVPTQEALMAVADDSHGVHLERIGASGMVSNQHFVFDMRINNPALTAQVLSSAARAACRVAPGSYTLIDIPLVALLSGERMDNIARLV